jgi:hypothetical protein
MRSAANTTSIPAPLVMNDVRNFRSPVFCIAVPLFLAGTPVTPLQLLLTIL